MSLRPASASAAVCLIAAATLLGTAWPCASVAQGQSAMGQAAMGQAAAPPAATEDAPDDSVLPIPPVPPRIAEGADYDRCLDMLESDPSGADALAATMASAGAGEAAEHCHALAQVALGNTEDGAALLDKLADASKAPGSARAEVFSQADQAWMMAGQPTQAYASASMALRLMPDDPDLLIGHAVAAIALDKFAEAQSDLTQALELDPKRADALVLRATADRDLGQLDEAQHDIDKAFVLDDDDPDAFLERGIIRQRRGDLAGARSDWQRVLDSAPDTPTGDLAQQNLALLDAGPRQ